MSKSHNEFENNMSKQISFLNRRADLRSRSIHLDLNKLFGTASYDIHVHESNRLGPNETNVDAHQGKRTTQNKKDPKQLEIITSSLSKYISRMQFQSHPTLGLLLLTIFISDPDDRAETVFIKLTNNQLGETANRIGGQKDKLGKWSEKKR